MIFSPINCSTSRKELQVKEDLMEEFVKEWVKLHIEIRMIISPEIITMTFFSFYARVCGNSRMKKSGLFQSDRKNYFLDKLMHIF